MLAIAFFGTAMVVMALATGANLLIRSLYHPDIDAATELTAMNERNRRIALADLAAEQQFKELSQRKFGKVSQALGQASLAGTQFIGLGMEDESLRTGYLDKVSTKMGMSPQDLMGKLDPRALGSSTVGRAR